MKKLLVLIVFLSAACTQEDKGSALASTISWKTAGTLPAPEGYGEAIGISGAYAGFIGDKLIVAGGANFPRPWQLETGPQGKEFYADIFVFDAAPDGTLTAVGKGMFPQKLASGIALADGDKLYFVGGENAIADTSSIYEVRLNGNTPVVTEYGQLPFTWSLGAAALYNGKIYLVGGRKNRGPGGGAVNEAWVYDLASKQTSPLPSLPGGARVQSPFALVGEKLYVFNGIGGNTVLTDAYAYDIPSGSWVKLADSTLNGQPFSVAGGAAVPLTDTKVAVIGGVNKEIFEDAVAQLGSLQGQALIDFRVKYFGMSPEEFKFSKELMVYDTAANTWSSEAVLPFIGGAGPFPLLRQSNKIWHISGEIKAAVRTPDIKVGILP